MSCTWAFSSPTADILRGAKIVATSPLFSWHTKLGEIFHAGTLCAKPFLLSDGVQILTWCKRVGDGRQLNHLEREFGSKEVHVSCCLGRIVKLLPVFVQDG